MAPGPPRQKEILMSSTVRTGLSIGFAVVAWTFVMGFTGWYLHPTLLNLFFLVIPIQIVLLVVGLGSTRRRTATESRSWREPSRRSSRRF